MSIHYADDKLVRGSEILELYEDAGWTLLRTRKAAEIEQSIRQAEVFITAREGARLIGFVAAISDQTYYAHVTEMVVRRAWQARDVGAELLRRALEAAGQERVVSIFAEPEHEALYRRLGFTPMGGAMMLRRD